MAVTCKLSTLMGEYRFSIQDVHEMTGLARNTISKLYYDKVSRIDYSTVEKLCTLFGCSISDLIYVTLSEQTGAVGVSHGKE